MADSLPYLNIPLDLIERHAAWSRKTFGEDHERDAGGPLRHLSKEALEAAETNDHEAKVVEFADCMFLFLDAMRRANITNHDLVSAMQFKMPILESRKYSRVENGQPSEHDRSIPD